jgi:outer membrane immunogenic protein
MLKRMKKQFFAMALVAFVLSAGSAVAQTKVGAFLGYGTEVEQLGIGGIAEFALNDRWAISPSLLFYFPEKNGNVKASFFEFNANANYYFLSQNSVNLYGLGGINYFRVKVKNTDTDDSVTGDEVGVNLGIGANFNTSSNIIPFGEIKFVLGDADQLALFFGVKFKLR